MNGMEFHQQVRSVPCQEEWQKRFRQTKEVSIKLCRRLHNQNESATYRMTLRALGVNPDPFSCQSDFLSILRTFVLIH